MNTQCTPEEQAEQVSSVLEQVEVHAQPLSVQEEFKSSERIGRERELRSVLSRFTNTPLDTCKRGSPVEKQTIGMRFLHIKCRHQITFHRIHQLTFKEHHSQNKQLNRCQVPTGLACAS